MQGKSLFPAIGVEASLSHRPLLQRTTNPTAAGLASVTAVTACISVGFSPVSRIVTLGACDGTRCVQCLCQRWDDLGATAGIQAPISCGLPADVHTGRIGVVVDYIGQDVTEHTDVTGVTRGKAFLVL